MVPKGLLYTETHEWIKVDNNSIATIGITDYAQEELGDIVFVELPEEGEVLNSGDPCGTIEAVKAVEEIFSPVSGEVVEVNKSLEDDAGVINSDPYELGWIVRIELKDEDELEELLKADEYSQHIGE